MSLPGEISSGGHVTKEEAKFLIGNHLEQVRYYDRKPSKIAVNTTANDAFDNLADISDSSDHEILKLSSQDAIIYTLRTFVSNEAAASGASRCSEKGDSSAKPSTSTAVKQTCYACNGSKKSKTKKENDFLNNRTYDRSVNSNLVDDQYHYPAPPYDSSSRDQALFEEERTCETCNGTGEIEGAVEDKKDSKLGQDQCGSSCRKESKVNDCLYDVFVKCDDSSIPLRILTKSKGTVILNQTSRNVSFVNHFPDVKINMACNDMILRHENRVRENPNTRITRQSHQLIVVPITTCSYRIPSSSKKLTPANLLNTLASRPTLRNDKVINFKIIGENKMVYIPKRNKNCCPIS